MDGSRRLRSARKGLYALVGLGIFAGGATLSSGYKIDLSVAPRPGPASDGSYYVPAFKVQSGPQLVMVYVGSSTCPWANQRSLPEALETIKVRLAAVAREHGMGFKAVGLALDWSPERGIAHLKRFGHFDEIAAGGSWGGTLALRYLWSDAQVAAATPQVLVYTRMFLAPAEATDPFLYEERERRTRAVRRGFVEITEWAESGAALDLSVPGAARTDPATSSRAVVSDEGSFSHQRRHGSRTRSPASHNASLEASSSSPWASSRARSWLPAQCSGVLVVPRNPACSWGVIPTRRCTTAPYPPWIGRVVSALMG